MSVDRASIIRGASRDADGIAAPARGLSTLLLSVFAFAALLLALAPAASASKAAVGSIENPRDIGVPAVTGGNFSTSITGNAVNSTGNGGVTAGDFYVVDAGYNRIQRFSSAGQFREMWGFDVVASGPGNGDAVQSLTVDATGGQFKLSFGGDTTGDLAYNATAAQVQTALRGLGSIGSGNVTVTGGPGGSGGSVPYGIFFEGALAGTAQSAITVAPGTTPLSGGAASATVNTINPGAQTAGFESCKVATSCKAGVTSSLGGGFNSPFGIAVEQSTGNVYVTNRGVHRVDVFTATGVFVRAFGLDVVNTGKPGDDPARPAKQSLTVKATGGQFKLSFQGKSTGDLGYDASAAEVQGALQALSSVGPQGVTVSGGPGDEGGTAPYVLTFGAALNNSPQPLVATSSGSSPLSGPGAGAVVTTTQAGSTGAEVCVVPAECKAGVTGGVAGALNAPSGVAFAPAGSPNAGNVLVTENANFRVSEFTPRGAFVRTFGFGVIALGPNKTTGAATAVQRVKVAGVSGSFKLSFEAQTTSALPYDASAAEVRDALNALSTIGGRGGSVTVTGGPGDASGSNPYLVTFGGVLAGKPLPQITLDGSGLGVGVGTELTCTPNAAAPDGTTYQWLRNGAAIGGATTTAYTVGAADEGKGIQCQAFTRFGNTITTQASTPVVVSPVPSPSFPAPPASIAAPVATGNLEGLVARELTCNAGAWGNAPTEYTYVWLRGGQQVGTPVSTAATSTKLTVSAGEQLPATGYQCVVTAKNATGSTVKASALKTTTPEPAPQARMVEVTIPALSGVEVVTAGAPGFEVCAAASFDVCQIGVSGQAPGQFGPVMKIAQDPSGNIYAIDAGFGPFRMQYFSQSGGTITPQGAYAPDVLTGTESGLRPTDVAIGPGGNVFVVKIYKKGQLPACIAPEPGAELLIHEFDSSGELVDTHIECNNGGITGAFVSAPIPHGLAVDAVTGRTYLLLQPSVYPYVLMIDEPDGPHVTVNAATDVRGSSARLNAEIEPLKGPWNTYYHFEVREAGESRWDRHPASILFDPVLGNGTGSGSSKACPDGNPPKCEVSLVASGLRPGAEYEVRLMAYTWSGGTVSTNWVGETFGGYAQVSGPNFTTAPSAPSAVTGNANWSSPAATRPSLDLEGLLNAASSSSTFVFEYVTEEQFQASGWANASIAPKAPARPVEAGQSFIDVEVRQSIANLDPSKTYRYRLVATNANGADYGETRVVGPPEDDAFYPELISNADGEGMGAAAGFGQPFWGVSDDGKRAYFSSQASGTPRSLSGLNTPFGSDRGDNGWNVFQVGADPKRALGGFLPGDYQISPDLSGAIWLGGDRNNWLSKTPFVSFSSANGDNALLSQLVPNSISTAGVGSWRMVGGSRDFDTYAFMPPGGVTMLPGEIVATNTGNNYFQITGLRSGKPELSMVNVDASGQQIGGKCGTLPGGAGQNAGGEVTARSSISVDGRVIYFTAVPNPPATGVCNATERNGTRLLKRVDAEKTIAVSDPTCTPVPLCGGPAAPDLYRGASLDGDVVVFKTNRRIVPADQDSTNDVYVYDETPPAGQPKLVQISAGQAVSPEHPTPGTGATTQGVLSISNDGSRIYFVATGRLTPEATAGANNLYVYQRDDEHPAGSLKYLAKFGAGASSLWTLASSPILAVPMRGDGPGESWGDGRFLVFLTTEALLAEDTDNSADMYRIDSEATSDAITCMSCAGSGELPVSAVGHSGTGAVDPFWSKPRISSDDGEVVVFWTEERLLPEDTNGGIDVYAWNHGELELITRKAVPDAKPRPSAGTTGDGSVVFYYTAGSEVPFDQNSAGDVYVARTGGGFPTPEGTFITCLSGNECKAAPAPVAPPVNPGSASLIGPDNPPLKKAKKCNKNQVRKGGKCVKKPPAKCKKNQVRKGGKCVKKKKAASKSKRASAHRQARSGK